MANGNDPNKLNREIRSLQIAQQRAIAEQSIAEALQEAANNAGETLNAQRQELEILRAKQQLAEATLELAKLTDANNRSNLEALQRDLIRARDDLNVAQQKLSLQQESAQLVKGLIGIQDSYQQRLVTNLVKTRDLTGTINNITLELKRSLDDAGGSSAFFASNLIKVKEVANSLSNQIIEATKNLAFEQEQALVGFSKMTGQTGQLRNELLDIERSLFKYGVSIQDATKAQSALFGVVTQFTMITAKQRSELANTTAVLDRFGVGAEVTAQNSEILMRQLGMTATEAGKLNVELFNFARESGLATSKVASDFGRLAPQLMAFGNQSITVFKQLEFASKQTGFSVENMLSVTAKFDRFDSAADSVGRLNAILGGPYLSTVQMVTATNPVERMQMLSDAVRSAGLSFEQLSYYERQALTEGMGLQNVGELAIVMRGQFDLLNTTVNQTSDDYIRLAKEQRSFSTVLEQYKRIIRSVATEMLPLVQKFGDFLETLLENEMAVKMISGAALGLTTALTALPGLITASALGFSVLNPIVTATGIGLLTMAASVTGLFNAFTQSGSPKFYDMGYYIAGGFNAMAGAAGTASQGMGVLGSTIGNISSAMRDIPDMKVTQFKTIMQETRRVTEEVNSAGAGPASMAIGIARATAASGAGGYGPGAGQMYVPINVNIDGETIRRSIKSSSPIR